MTLNRREFVQGIFAASQVEPLPTLLLRRREGAAFSSTAAALERRSLTHGVPVPSTSVLAGSISAPTTDLPPVDHRGWETWDDVGAVMRKAPNCAMCQSSLSNPEQKLRPGIVAVAHHGNDLIVYAELTDDDIFNPVKMNGVDAFTRGDVIEISFGRGCETAILNTTLPPDNYILQLRWPSVRVVNKFVKDTNAGKHVDYLSLFAEHRSGPEPNLGAGRSFSLADTGCHSSRSSNVTS